MPSNNKGYKPKQLVLSKMSGYPAWPSFITPEEAIPKSVFKARKNKSAYCVMFIPDGDFYWMTEKNIKLLSQEQIDKEVAKIDPKIRKNMKNLKFLRQRRSIPNRKGSSIQDAYAASSGLDFDTFIEIFRDDEIEEEEEEVEEEEEEADDVVDDKEEKEEPKQEEYGLKDYAADVKQVSKLDVESPSDHEVKPKTKGKGMRVKKPSNGKEIEDEAEYGDVEDTSEELASSRDSRRQRRESRQLSASTAKKSKQTATATGAGAGASAGAAAATAKTPPPSNGIKRKVESTPEGQIMKKSRADSSGEEEVSIAKGKGAIANDASGAGTTSINSSSVSSSSSTTKNSKHPTSEAERYQQLHLCRYKLQKSLIQRHQEKDSDGKIIPNPPSADELSVARLILYRLSDFPMTKDLLKRSKIHKVLKCIIKDPELEYAKNFQLHERSKELLDQWHGMIEEINYEKRLEQEKATSSKDSNQEQSSNDTNNNGEKSHLSVIKNGVHGPDESEVSGMEQSIQELENKFGDEAAVDSAVDAVVDSVVKVKEEDLDEQTAGKGEVEGKEESLKDAATTAIEKQSTKDDAAIKEEVDNANKELIEKEEVENEEKEEKEEKEEEKEKEEEEGKNGTNNETSRSNNNLQPIEEDKTAGVGTGAGTGVEEIVEETEGTLQTS
ncbi:hypothetical protein PVL30_005480 [Lodderomyces elongisporus]|uniref:uncharacterized protein n=1 Tax=Lodderomyces elongisporus TaxID=36914 RepID=UPI002926059F|nr:uncharacterized protein PVL30_005480 [Lodderomyces elongisporus]WLF81681.1 hypothetical protein PVL30_005480 [Lodderomyces elongisporus]